MSVTRILALLLLLACPSSSTNTTNAATDSVFACLSASVTIHPAEEPQQLSAALDACNSAVLVDANKKCALGCTTSAIGVYWACAAVCIKKQAPTSCITVGCLAATSAYDVKCLTGCNHTAASSYM